MHLINNEEMKEVPQGIVSRLYSFDPWLHLQIEHQQIDPSNLAPP
jgi:hypothetical protein